MSNPAKLSKTHRKVLDVLIEYHKLYDGRINPGVSTLATKSGCSDRTVQRALRTLEQRGVISMIEPERWGRLTRTYVFADWVTNLNVSSGDKKDKSDRVTKTTKTGEKRSGDKSQKCHPIDLSPYLCRALASEKHPSQDEQVGVLRVIEGGGSQ